MTALRERFPHASESFLRLNAPCVAPAPREPAGIPPPFVAFLAVEIVSEANRASSEHWRVRQRRAKKQREAVRAAWGSSLAGLPKPCVIQLTRVGAREYDHSDNEAAAAKHIRDELAAILGFNDRDKGVRWRYAWQRKGKGEAGGVWVHIRWTPVRECETCHGWGFVAA